MSEDKREACIQALVEGIASKYSADCIPLPSEAREIVDAILAELRVPSGAIDDATARGICESTVSVKDWRCEAPRCDCWAQRKMEAAGARQAMIDAVGK